MPQSTGQARFRSIPVQSCNMKEYPFSSQAHAVCPALVGAGRILHASLVPLAWPSATYCLFLRHILSHEPWLLSWTVQGSTASSRYLFDENVYWIAGCEPEVGLNDEARRKLTISNITRRCNGSNMVQKPLSVSWLYLKTIRIQNRYNYQLKVVKEEL